VKEKQFKKSQQYCLSCSQRKVCGALDKQGERCCFCYRKILEELEKDGLLVSSSRQRLNDYRVKAIKCRCVENEKTQVKTIFGDGRGVIKCEGVECDRILDSAGHHQVIKNRNNPAFWGLDIPKKVLCLSCLKKQAEQLTSERRKVLNKYVKRGYV
jgi:hypothetical protein